MSVRDDVWLGSLKNAPLHLNEITLSPPWTFYCTRKKKYTFPFSGLRKRLWWKMCFRQCRNVRKIFRVAEWKFGTERRQLNVNEKTIFRGLAKRFSDPSAGILGESESVQIVILSVCFRTSNAFINCRKKEQNIIQYGQGNTYVGRARRHGNRVPETRFTQRSKSVVGNHFAPYLTYYKQYSNTEPMMIPSKRHRLPVGPGSSLAAIIIIHPTRSPHDCFRKRTPDGESWRSHIYIYRGRETNTFFKN